MERLKELPTASLWDIFEHLAHIPHASGNEKEIAHWILDFAQKHDIEGTLDQVGNVILHQKATKGLEHLPIICMQGHIDMVAVKGETSKHDFSKDPLELKIVEINEIPFVTANDTTLGADDCIGVAAALAIMSDPDLEHGELEALFTIGEETSMVGMSALEPNKLGCKYLLNLDSENDQEVTIGCAGGEDAHFEIPLSYVDQTEFSSIRLSLIGLIGGHSGIEIYKHQANAIQTLALVLKEISKQYPIYLQSFTGGTFRNAIPNEATVVFATSKENIKPIEELCSKLEADLKKQYEKTDPNLILMIETDLKESFKTISLEDTKKVIEIISSMPNGVITMSKKYKDIVETSSNLGIIKTLDGKITTESLMRSFIDTTPVCNILSNIAKQHGVKVTFSNKYQGWTPKQDSKLVKIFEKIYEDFNFKKPKVTIIHAGLECGIFISKYPNVDVISFGPTIIGAHTIKEKVSIYSVEKFYGLLLELINEIKE